MWLFFFCFFTHYQIVLIDAIERFGFNFIFRQDYLSKELIK